MKYLKPLFFIIYFITVLSLFALAIRGQRGNPVYYQTERDRSVGGPFESSNNTSRFALVESIVEDKSVTFNEEKTRFSSPDTVLYNDKFFSIFTPGVSFIGVPFYIIGKWIGYQQLSTYMVNILAALVNLVLIYKISKKLGAGNYTALLSGTIFLFATNALSYALGFTQHHLSTALILTGVMAATGKNSFLKNLILGAAFGASILMDIPNIFMFAPILIYAFLKHIETSTVGEKIKVSFRLSVAGIIIGLIPFLFIFSLYNQRLTGSYLKIGQLIGRTEYPAKEVIQKEPPSTVKDLKLIETPFSPRLGLNGLFILLVSNERGIIYYSPVVVLGVIGLIVAYHSKKKKRKEVVVLMSSIVAINVILYSTFGDPWGGWSYGSRYLIPTAALLSLGIAPAFHRFKKKPILMILSLVVVFYSLSVSALGALTTVEVPPKGEALALQNPIPYTFQYNYLLMQTNFSSSLFYNTYLFNSIPVSTYLIMYITIMSSLLLLTGAFAYKEKETSVNDN